MGDTTKVAVTEAWAPISGLTTARTYGFQNIVMKPMYLIQQATTPDANDTGYELPPFKTAILIKEVSDIFVRMVNGDGIAYLNELV